MGETSADFNFDTLSKIMFIQIILHTLYDELEVFEFFKAERKYF